MASRIEAINAYRPKIDRGNRVENDELIELISSRTGLNESEVRSVMYELRDGVVFFNKQGRATKLVGLGTYSPSINLDGEISVNHRTDKEITRHLNIQGEFRGTILHRENIGKTSDDLVEMWNEEHPDDPVE